MTYKDNPLTGCWKITWMEMWDQDYVDEEVPGHITFEEKGKGHFQFGYVRGYFQWSRKDPSIDSFWEGSDELDDASGKLYASLENGKLSGSIAFFDGDESEFRAVRKNKRPTS